MCGGGDLAVWYIIASLSGMAAGAVCVYLAFDSQRKRLREQKKEQSAQAEKLLKSLEQIRAREKQGIERLREKQKQVLEFLKARESESSSAIKSALEALEERKSGFDKRQQDWELSTTDRLRAKETEYLATVRAQLQQIEGMKAGLVEEHGRQLRELDHNRRQFDAQVVSFDEVQRENELLKRDLKNSYVQNRKLQLDRNAQQFAQQELSERCAELAQRFLKENEKWIGNSLNANNFASCKQRLLDVIERCREIGFEISPEKEADLLGELRQDFEKAVRAAFEREEQSRIKAQIREEQLREKEVERELKQLERERAAIATALERALAEAKDEHSAEIENLKARLKEAEENSERAISQAQLTKSGHVYVISNVGSFGDGIYKIGMTRRLEPLDRVKELGDASVPFPFDIHMMISCDDAPALENAIHRTLHKLRINKINLRKEFFRTSFDEIKRIVEENHGRVEYTADAEALEYRQSASMTEDDQEFIEGVYDKFEDDGNGTNGD